MRSVVGDDVIWLEFDVGIKEGKLADAIPNNQVGDFGLKGR